MKYAVIVLANMKNPLSSVDYQSVTDAFLSGGVFLDEVVMLPYEEADALMAALSRLLIDCGGVFLICDKPLLRSAFGAFEAMGASFEGSFAHMKETGRLVAVFPAGEEGANAVRTGQGTIDGHRENSFLRVVIRAMSVPPELLTAAIAQAEAASQGKLDLHVGEKNGDLRVEIIYDRNTPKMIADEVVRILATGLRGYIYAMDDISVQERLVEALALHRLKIAAAESFTGGAIARAIVSVSGASRVFYEGLNTYDSKAKAERLGVSEYTLMSKGAVSEETAYEMAAGLLAQGHCDVAIASTGNAGPTAERNTPVGLCFLAVATKERVQTYKLHFEGDRNRVIDTAVNLALFLAYKEVK